MSDVYIVHASEDNELTVKLASLLEKYWVVWWDEAMVGDFGEVITREMADTKCVVAIWSRASVVKDTVLDELRLAKQANRKIVPIIIDDANPPYPLGRLSNVNFAKWDGTETHAAFKQLLRKISTVVPRRIAPIRPSSVKGTSLVTPAVFLSVSSHETQLVPLEAVKALRVFGSPAVLISAYDLWDKRRPSGIEIELQKIREAGGVVLVDSGNYEATRRDDTTWSYERFYESLQGIPQDWCYCFDVMEPSAEPEEAVAQVVEAVRRDTKATGLMVLPIVHTTRSDSGYNIEELPAVVRAVAQELEPPIIAVAERELGRGMIQRALTVKKIRAALTELPYYQPLHILGTGNPWSIAILTAAGADSFDGLEWCRMVVDHSSNRLNHYQHFDFFTYQTEFSDSEVTLTALKDDKVDYAGKVAFHNLEYYRMFAAKLNRHAHSNRMEALLVSLMGESSTNQLSDLVPEIFSR